MLTPRFMSRPSFVGSYAYLAGLGGPDVVITHDGVALDTRFDLWRVDGDELRHERTLVLAVANVQSAVTDADDDLLVLRSVARDGSIGYVLERIRRGAEAPAWTRGLDQYPDVLAVGDDDVALATAGGLVRLRRSDGVELARDPRRSPCAWDPHRRQWVACAGSVVRWDDEFGSDPAPGSIQEFVVTPARRLFARLVYGSRTDLWIWELGAGWRPLAGGPTIRRLAAHPAREAVYCLHGACGVSLVAADGARIHRRHVVADQARALAGRDALVCVGNFVGAVRLVDFERHERIDGHDGAITTLAWTTDGAVISCSAADRRALRTDPAGETAAAATPPDFELRCAARGPGETWLSGQYGELLRWPDAGPPTPVASPAGDGPLARLCVSADGRSALAVRVAGPHECTLERWQRTDDGWALHAHLVTVPMLPERFVAVTLARDGGHWLQPLVADRDDDDDDALELCSDQRRLPLGPGVAADIGLDLALVADRRRLTVRDLNTGELRADRTVAGAQDVRFAPRGLVVVLRRDGLHDHLDILRAGDLALLHSHPLALRGEACIIAIGGPGEQLAIGSRRGERCTFTVDWDALAGLEPVTRPSHDPGTNVRLVSGSFAGFAGVVLSVDGDTVTVEVNLFGRSTPVPVTWAEIAVP
jgi:hypothetical protein